MKTLLSVLLALFTVTAAAADKPVPPSHPQLAVTTLDGASWQLAAQRGSWVLVNFWATWCSPCIKEMPEIDHFTKAHANVVAIGLAWQDAEPDAIKAFLAEHPVSYPIALLDPFEAPGEFAAPRGLPTSYLIDPSGKLVRTFVGPLTAVDLAKAIGVAPPAS